MNSQVYVLRRKITKIGATPVPDSTYKSYTPRKTKRATEIKSNPYFDELARPKPVFPEPELEEIPKYMNDPPEFESIDLRVTQAQLLRDQYSIELREKKEQLEKESEPVKFIEWQKKMKEMDEEEGREAIQRRRKELDLSRKNAIQSKKNYIKKMLESEGLIRKETKSQIEKAREDIEKERDEIKRLKREMVDKVPIVLAQVANKKRAETKEMKKRLREDLKALNRRNNEEIKQKREQAVIVRDRAKNHEGTIRGKFTAKVNITDTKFLANMTDEETEELRSKNIEKRKLDIENLIQEHRKTKEEKLDKMIEILNKEAEYRALREEEHERIHREKQERIKKELEIKAQEEEQKLLKLEKKLEKKHKARIQEAQEMEDHMRTIQARNRYLAINKKAQAEKSFQSILDGSLRSAKERQASIMREDRPTSGIRKNQVSPELSRLKDMLGL